MHLWKQPTNPKSRGGRPISAFSITKLLLLVPLVVACDDPLPTGGDDHGDATDELQVDLTLSPGHVHILSEIQFSAEVSDHHGEPVTDFDEIHVEHRPVGSTTWSEVELQLEGTSWVGSDTFNSSGDYEVRVRGQRPGDASLVVMYEMDEHLHAARAHADAGGYRVEFEAFPGHIHEGDSGILRFWVMELEEDASGNRAPVPGLGPEIRVTEGDASASTYAADETSDGVYEAEHGFGSAGDAVAALHFTGSGGAAAEAGFTVHVSHAH